MDGGSAQGKRKPPEPTLSRSTQFLILIAMLFALILISWLLAFRHARPVPPTPEQESYSEAASG